MCSAPALPLQLGSHHKRHLKIPRNRAQEELTDMDMEKEDAVGKSAKKHARLHRSFSFLHLSRALGKLHGRRGHADAKGEPSLPSSSAATSFLSGCMHPRTHSFASGRRQGHRHRHEDDAHAAALDVTFRSLRVGPAAAVASSSAQDDSHSDGEPGPGAAAPKAVVARGAGVAVVTFSAAPYEDFRRSMREMVDAAAAPAAVDWDFMEELLFCYLHLNDRAVHKDILRAFTDTVAAIRWNSRRARRRKQQHQQPRATGDGHHGNSDEAETVQSS